MIRHAPEAALFPVDPLPVPVIELSLRAVLVFPVGNAAFAGVSSGVGTLSPQ